MAYLDAEFEEWHSDLTWMQQVSVWPPGLKAKFKDEQFPWSHHCLLLQPHHITSFCSKNPAKSDAANREIVTARLQRLVTAVSRISLHQRMQLVFQGYKARFAEIGAYCQGVFCSTLNTISLIVMRTQLLCMLWFFLRKFCCKFGPCHALVLYCTMQCQCQVTAWTCWPAAPVVHACSDRSI